MTNPENITVSKVLRSNLDALSVKYSIAKMLEKQIDDFYHEINPDYDYHSLDEGAYTLNQIYEEKIRILQKFLLELLDDET